MFRIEGGRPIKGSYNFKLKLQQNKVENINNFIMRKKNTLVVEGEVE